MLCILNSKIFINEKLLLSGALPPELPFREKEMSALASNYKILFDRKTKSKVNQNLSTIILILGTQGQGKTTLAKITTKHLVMLAEKNKVRLISSYQNCWQHRTIVGVISNVFEDLNIKGTKKGISLDEQIAGFLMPYLIQEDKHLLIVLDEVNRLRGDEINSLFSLIEMSTSNSYISMIFISRPTEWKLLLSPDLNQRITDTIVFSPYTYEQLIKILNYRATLSLIPTSFDEDIINLVGEITAKDQNNIRLGLEIIYRAAKISESKNLDYIEPDFIRQAKGQSFPELRNEILGELKVHELFTILGIARRLSNKKFSTLSIKDSYRYYKIASAEWFEEPKKESSFRTYLSSLNNLGLINQIIAPSGRGKRGVKARISITDVPVDLIIERVEHQLEKLYE